MLPDEVVRRLEDNIVGSEVFCVAADQPPDDRLEAWAGLRVKLDTVQVPGPVHRRKESKKRNVRK